MPLGRWTLKTIHLLIELIVFLARYSFITLYLDMHLDISLTVYLSYISKSLARLEQCFEANTARNRGLAVHRPSDSH